MRKFTIFVLILALTLVVMCPDPVRAQGSLTPTWSSVIAYFNPNETDTELGIIYYKSTGGYETSGTIYLTPHMSGVVLVGSTANFKGSAVISSTKPLMAVYKQESSSREPFSPILYTSFELSQAGDGDFFLPTVQRTELFDTQVGIQNIGSISINVSLDFYDKDGTLTSVAVGDIDPSLVIGPQASRIFKLSEISKLSTGFDGSLVIHASLSDGSGNGGIVAVAQDILVGGRQAYTYEGTMGGSQNIYMPAALCQFGSGQQTTRYWVQNTGSDTANITVDYFYNSGADPDTPYASQTISPDLAPGVRTVINVCGPNTGGSVVGKSLSARIRSDGQTIAAVGKTTSTDGLYTAFSGQSVPASCAPTNCNDSKFRTVLPYVEYATSKNGYKTYITVQNVGTSDATGVVVNYYPRAGGTPVSRTLGTIHPGSSLPTDASMVRAFAPGTRGFFGAVEIVSDNPIVALARVQFAVSAPGISLLGEDYGGLSYYLPYVQPAGQ